MYVRAHTQNLFRNFKCHFENRAEEWFGHYCYQPLLAIIKIALRVAEKSVLNSRSNGMLI